VDIFVELIDISSNMVIGMVVNPRLKPLEHGFGGGSGQFPAPSFHFHHSVQKKVKNFFH
jgi:hypothetical protein